ncbi:MAG: PQQ-binding-like beta-propeller repeat protein [Bacteroidetes bacterium]|nr:PQQ-binding-like beta-propeller repeat protein [Bacteroidota bacterium]
MNIRRKNTVVFSAAVAIVLYASGQSSAQYMYRGNAAHNLNYNSAVKGFFDACAWKFDADAPVRSTAVVAGNSVYFGSSRGIFYCLEKNSGKIKWTFRPAGAINSSAAVDNGNVFFSDNRQTLFSLNALTGSLNWKTNLGKAKSYDWAFDYTYSSPAISKGHILIGSKDGNVYNVDERTGTITWRFKTNGIVRSSPAIDGNTVYVGDSEGDFFAINLHSGRQQWRFEMEGRSLQNEKFGFDRRAVIAAPIVAGDKVLFGGRDGFGYCLDKSTGKQVWRIDHEVSWIISAMTVKGNIMVTGTSDGHFVQAINLKTGKQLWKFHTVNVVWSSPIIDMDKVYVGSHEGMLYCLDLATGRKLSGYQTGGNIFGSPVINGQMLYIGSDDGFLYALKPGPFRVSPVSAPKYVFWDESVPSGSPGNDIRIRKYLHENGYAILNKEKLAERIGKTDSAANSVIVFATNYIPEELTKGGRNSVFREYLDHGGKIVVLGADPLILKYDAADKAVVIRNFLFADSVIGIKYGPNDLRSYKGNQPAFATKAGTEWGIKSFWAAPLSIDPKQADVVLGSDENGLASAWVKKFNPSPGSGFVQIWTGENDRDLNFIMRVAEYGLK